MNFNKIEFRIRYADTDHFGVVYYSKYLDWMEAGRTEILRDNGINYAQLEDENKFAPVVHLEIDYMDSPKYDDIVVLETKIEKIGNSSVTFSYEIKSKEGKLFAKATTVNVFITKDREKVNVPKTVRKILEN